MSARFTRADWEAGEAVHGPVPEGTPALRWIPGWEVRAVRLYGDAARLGGPEFRTVPTKEDQ